MVLPDYPPPLKRNHDSASTRSSLRSSMHKSRHVSMQSRVDSIAAESMYRSWEDYRDSVPEIPAAYDGGLRSTSFLLKKEESQINVDPLSTSEMSDSSVSPAPLAVPALKISLLHEVLFVGVAVMAQFMCLAGLGQAIAPVNYIASGLGVTSPGEQSWFAASYALTTGTFILISGRLGDILGHKRVFVFGYLFLGIWSGFAGFSAYVGRQIFFDFCRAMQGVGGALLAPNALALLGRAYPPGIKKNLIFALFGAMAPWGFVVGGLMASVFAEMVWWPWAFWSYGIAGFALSAFALLVVPKQLANEAQFAGQASRPGFDWIGSAVGVTGLVLVNVAWNNGPLFGWGTPHVYFLLIIGMLCLVAFVWIEMRAVSPLLPVRALSGAVTYTMALVAIGWGSFGIWIYYSFRFLEQLRGESPLTVSIEYLPALVCGLLAAGATGFMLTHTPISFTMLVAMLAFFVGHVLAGTMPIKQIYWAQMFVSILIMPFGMDMSFPAATITISNHMPKEHQGLAASLVNTMVNYSISIALGIAGTVETAVNNKGATPEDIVWGIRCAYYSGMALAGCGVILGALFFVKTLRKEGWKVMDH